MLIRPVMATHRIKLAPERKTIVCRLGYKRHVQHLHMQPVENTRLSLARNSHLVYRDLCFKIRERMLKKVLPGSFKRGTISPEKRGVSVDYGSLCWKETKKSSQCHLADKTIMQKTTLENYPMEHTCSDTVKLYQDLRVQRHRDMLNKKREEGQSKQMLLKNRQLFESALQEKRKTCLSPPELEDSLLFPEIVSGHVTDSVHPPKTSILVKRPGSKYLCSFGADKLLDHCRGRCKAQPRICRHIKKISSQYKVECTSPPHICEARWNAGNYSSGSEFFLVPLHKEQSAVELADTKESQLTMEEDVKSEHSVQFQEVLETEATSRQSIAAPAISKEEIEESEGKCWVDDATVTTTRDIEHISEVTDKGEDETSAQQQSIQDIIETAVLLRTPGSKPLPIRTHSSDVAGEANIVPSRVEVLPKKSIIEDTKAKSVMDLPAAEQVRLPGLICPSDVKKSQKAEIKKWLQQSSFSAASKPGHFIT